MAYQTMQDRAVAVPVHRHSDPQSDQKLGELILYIALACQHHNKFGAIKLNKILFFSDFISYLRHGQPITGAQYMRKHAGPVPVRLVPVRENLERSRSIAVVHRRMMPFVQHRIVALREPDWSLFRPEQIALVDWVVNSLKVFSADAVSRLSHQKAWQIARDGEIIPYSAVLLSDERVMDQDILEAHELIEKYGWRDV